MKHFQLDVVGENVLGITFKHRDYPVNRLDAAVFEEISLLLDELSGNSSYKAAWLHSAQRHSFIEGYNYDEILALEQPEALYQFARSHQQILQRWQNLSLPTVALVNGRCSGCGIDWISAFTTRLATSDMSTSFALPQVHAGITPWMGSTVRLGSLLGIKESAAFLIDGVERDTDTALALGLIDDYVHPEEQQEQVLLFLQKMQADTRFLPRLRKKHALPRVSEVGRGSYLRRQIKLAAALPDRQAAAEALKSLQHAMAHTDEEALGYEARKFAVVAASTTGRNLLRIAPLYQLQTPAIVPETDESLLRIAVVGAGRIGRGIALLAASRLHPVRLKDLHRPQLSEAVKYIHDMAGLAASALERPEYHAGIIRDRVSPTSDYSGFTTVKVVFEALPEHREKKLEMMRELERHIPESTLIVTSTSTLPLESVAAACSYPARLAAIHFHYPVYQQRFAEIIQTGFTSKETITRLRDLLISWGRVPVVCRDAPGYLLNRLLTPYYAEAFFLLKEGVGVDVIDNAMRVFGLQFGPFQQMQRNGLDYSYNACSFVHSAFQQRMPQSDLPGKLIEYNRTAEKPQFFYRGELPGRLNRPVYKVLEVRPRLKMSDVDIQERLLLILINEALYCLDEAVVATPPDVEKASLFALGFPRWHGGLLRYAESYKWKNVLSRMRTLAEQLGRQYTPSALLVRLGENTESLFADHPPAE